jgi:large subunit ribosomal protein L7/L12
MALSTEDILEAFDRMTILELVEFSRRFQERYGVTAPPPVIVPPAPPGDDGADTDEAATVPTAFNMVLTAAGANRIAVIRAVRELTGLGLTEARDAVNAVPTIIKEGVSDTEAEAARTKLVEAGATVEVVGV